MSSPRKIAKSLQFHARRLQIRALRLPRMIPLVRGPLRLPRNQQYDPLRDIRPDVRVIALDAAASFQRPLPELAEPDPAAMQFFVSHANEVTAASYVAEFDGGIAWGHPTGGVFTSDRRFAPAFTHDPCGPEFHEAWRRLRLPRARPLAGRTLYLVTPEATDNFHHWMIDLLPRLGLVQRAGYALASFDHVIVNHTGRRYQLETLARLGVAPERIVRADRELFVQAEQLVVPALKPTNQSLPPADVSFLRDAFLGPSPVAPGRQRLFLSRADAAYRRLRNESQLHGWLREHGFEIVRPSELSVLEQARRFAEAEVIAGPAGAAFANLVFATPPARVIEFVPPQWIAAYHWMISARLGLQHTIALGQGPRMRGVPDDSARQCDIVITPEQFAAAFAGASTPATA